MKKDLISLLDLDRSELLGILAEAMRYKQIRREGRSHDMLKGKTLAMIFEKPSTRTRISFEVGMVELGGHALYLNSQDLQIGRGEEIRDTARVASRYVSGVMIRSFNHETIMDFARYASIPVINGLSDREHPCQLLADMMTLEEHFRYFKVTIDAIQDIVHSNRYVRYISVFQNWLRPAGASVDHLHKQIVALDEWGTSIQNQIRMLREDPNVFNEYGVNFAAHHNLIFAENEYAIAFVGVGHRWPTIEIYSRSQTGRPHEHSDDEIRGMSNLVHACHAAMGSQLSCNEEWYYTPVDAVYKMPWHVLIRWRVSVPAGFEGGTSIYINPMTPIDLRDGMVPRLYKLRDENKIDRIRIAEECRVDPNPLKYYLK